MLLLAFASAGAWALVGRHATRTARKGQCVLLLTIDTWRSDALSAAGGGSPPLFLSRLAGQGMYLPSVMTPVPLTAPAHASILTGEYPYHHGIRDNSHYHLDPNAPDLARDFRRAGYQTLAFVSAAPLRRGIGLALGFDEYDEGALERSESGIPVTLPRRKAEQTVDAVLARLDRRPPDNGIFLWVHFYDLHTPYLDTGRPSADGYADEMRHVDSQVKRLVTALAQRFPALRVVIVGDHGEGFGEHDEYGHGIMFYEETLSVPAIFWPHPPGALAPGPYSLVDIAPTVRDWAGLPGEESDGLSLLRAVSTARWLYAEALEPTITAGISPAYAMRRGNRVAMFHGGQEAYDLAADPEERRNLMPGADFYGQAESALAALLAHYPESAIKQFSHATQEGNVIRLQQLGYLAGATSRSPLSWRRDDRRVYLKRFNDLTGGLRFGGADELTRHEAAFQSFLKLYPNSAQAHEELALILVRDRKYDPALKEFEIALSLFPDDANVLLNIGNIMLSKGDLPAARVYYRRALAIMPGDPVILYDISLTDHLPSRAPGVAVASIQNEFAR